MEFNKGEVVEWIVQDKNVLTLSRIIHHRARRDRVLLTKELSEATLNDVHIHSVKTKFARISL